MVCLTLSANWYWTDTNYDWFRPDYRDLYVLNHTDSLRNFINESCANWELQQLRRLVEGEDVDMGFFSKRGVAKYSTAESENTLPLSVIRMDTCTANILGLTAIHGSIDDALGTATDKIVITDDAAMKLFGRTDVVGEVLRNVSWGITATIKAVCPANDGMSHFNYDIIMPWTLSENVSSQCVVRTDNPKETCERFNAFQPYEKAHGAKTYRELNPLRTYHRLGPDRFMKVKSYMETYFYHIAFTLIALLLLVSAVTNLVMVFTSINLGRLREYALRRSMGATSWQNVEWILIGILPTMVITVMFAGVAMEWVLKLADIPWDIRHINSFYVAVLAVTVFVCMLGMMFPVYKLRRAYRSSFLGHGGGGHSHLWLIVMQCAACAFLLFLSSGMQRQVYGMINADLGYDHKNMLRLHTASTNFGVPAGFEKYYDFGAIFKDLSLEIRKEAGAGITDVIAMQADLFNRQTLNELILFDENGYPNSGQASYQDIYQNIVPHVKVQYVEVPFRAIDFFNIRTENGRKLLPEDDREDELQVYVNSEAKKLIAPTGEQQLDYYATKIMLSRMSITPDMDAPQHWENKRLNIKDVTTLRTNDFLSSAVPTVFTGIDEFHVCYFKKHDAIYIKYADGRREDAEAAVRKVLRKFDVPEGQYLLTTFDEHIAGIYEKEASVANLLTTLTVFTVAITLAGVLSMLLYSLRLRRRSMAIHRVMGATFKDIFTPTLRPYIIFAFIGALLAYFPAEILMTKWMEYFHYGEAPGVGLMLAILASMCAIIALIVWWQVSLCMKDKPVEILKPEA